MVAFASARARSDGVGDEARGRRTNEARTDGSPGFVRAREPSREFRIREPTGDALGREPNGLAWASGPEGGTSVLETPDEWAREPKTKG
ncbi:hypothetical protein GCM10010468_34970 [Actinocorallia longicatena]|uniref:Uncharacterized protein n=1 Tax=Actinocorallia longicatena TaxID=111803 RepID=A0ABP6Q9T7_9ACTN